MEMRKATGNDIGIFNEMYTNFFVSEDYTHKLEPMSEEKYQDLMEYESLYFAILDGQVIGFAILYAFEKLGCKIESLYVKEKSKGYGAEFYRLLEKEIRDSNIDRVYVHVFDERPERFWFRMGFRSVRGTEEFEKKLDLTNP